MKHTDFAECFQFRISLKRIAYKCCMVIFCHSLVPIIVITDLFVGGRKPVNFLLLSSSAAVSTLREFLLFLTICFILLLYCLLSALFSSISRVTHFIAPSFFWSLSILSDLSTSVIFHSFFCFTDLFLLHKMIYMLHILFIKSFRKSLCRTFIFKS